MKRKNIMFLMISLSLVLLLGSSYALLRSIQVGTIPYVINVGTLQVTFKEGSTNELSLNNMYPMSDKEGMSQTKELGFVVKNTGNIEARYNVYLEETSTDPEFKNHIRFISNKNDQGYNEPKTMGYDKYIDLGAILDSEDEVSASYKVKIWLDKDAENEYMDKTFTAKVIVESKQIDIENTIYNKIMKAIEAHPGTTIEEDGVTYLSGSNDDVNYNYVWYSGKLWRITSINSDGTVKIITQDEITAIYWNNIATYENSWIYQWLNEDFKDTLYNYQNIIVQNADWNATRDGNDIPVKPPIDASAEIVQGAVGLLNAYEYYQSYKNLGSYSKGYLNIRYHWWLMTPNSNSDVRYVGTGGYFNNLSPSSSITYGVRPSINLKSNIELSGEGTKSNPYTIIGDKSPGTSGELINTRSSGEYVRVDNKVYRIVGIENGTTKLTSVDYVRDASGEVLTKNFESNSGWEESVASGNNDYWGYYLNNTWLTANLKQYITEGTYYLGQVGSSTKNYKNSICSESNTSEPTKSCSKTTSTWIGLVGLPRVGEMFSAQVGEGYTASSDIWIITSYSNSDVRYVSDGGALYYHSPSSYSHGVRPSINLKSEVIISGGDGMTPDTAYEISIDS